jgi:hypothetical protein
MQYGVGMLLCASNDAHDAVDPPVEAEVGERCWFGNEQLQVRFLHLVLHILDQRYVQAFEQHSDVCMLLLVRE